MRVMTPTQQYCIELLQSFMRIRSEHLGDKLRDTHLLEGKNSSDLRHHHGIQYTHKEIEILLKTDRLGLKPITKVAVSLTS